MGTILHNDGDRNEPREPFHVRKFCQFKVVMLRLTQQEIESTSLCHCLTIEATVNRMEFRKLKPLPRYLPIFLLCPHFP